MHLDESQLGKSSYVSAFYYYISLAVTNEFQLKLFQLNVFLFKGEMTGVCVNTTKTCEVLAWCPVENDFVIPEYVKMLNYSDNKLTSV